MKRIEVSRRWEVKNIGVQCGRNDFTIDYRESVLTLIRIVSEKCPERYRYLVFNHPPFYFQHERKHKPIFVLTFVVRYPWVMTPLRKDGTMENSRNVTL